MPASPAPALTRALPLALVLAFLLSAPLAAQDPQAQARVARAREVLAPIAEIVGRWEGDADAMVGRGEMLLIRQLEDVVWGASGTVILIRGTGLSTEAATRGDTIFEAAAVLWVDETTGAPKMRTHRDGRSVDAEIEIRPDTVIWGFPVPGGRVRYTIALTDDTWYEIGEYLREGSPAIKTIEMRLRRVTP